MRRLLTVGLALLTLAIVAAPPAGAAIVVGQSIAGVKLLDTKAQVRQALGPPSSVQGGEFFYERGGAKARIGFKGGRVSGLLWFSSEQKTSSGITIGSSRTQLKRAYPQANCLEGPYGPKSLYCAVTSHLGGRETYTSFLFSTAKGGVVEIELGFGPGIAEELRR